MSGVRGRSGGGFFPSIATGCDMHSSAYVTSFGLYGVKNSTVIETDQVGQSFKECCVDFLWAKVCQSKRLGQETVHIDGPQF